jgi:hypothetical protein
LIETLAITTSAILLLLLYPSTKKFIELIYRDDVKNEALPHTVVIHIQVYRVKQHQNTCGETNFLALMNKN